jgi:hypothetical protein
VLFGAGLLAIPGGANLIAKKLTWPQTKKEAPKGAF